MIYSRIQLKIEYSWIPEKPERGQYRLLNIRNITKELFRAFLHENVQILDFVSNFFSLEGK